MLKRKIMSSDLLQHLSLIISEEEIMGKKVLEAGSRNVNGSIRSIIEPLQPSSYLGIDMEDGIGVDRICNICELVTEFGENYFDVILSTSTLEHVEDWRYAILNLKRVLIPGGMMVITVPGIGCKYHGYPLDFWRYEMKDIHKIFDDMDILYLTKEKVNVIVKIRKPMDFQECDLGHIVLYSIVKHKRIMEKDYVD